MQIAELDEALQGVLESPLRPYVAPTVLAESVIEEVCKAYGQEDWKAAISKKLKISPWWEIRKTYYWITDQLGLSPTLVGRLINRSRTTTILGRSDKDFRQVCGARPYVLYNAVVALNATTERLKPRLDVDDL